MSTVTAPMQTDIQRTKYIARAAPRQGHGSGPPVGERCTTMFTLRSEVGTPISAWGLIQRSWSMSLVSIQEVMSAPSA